MTPIPSSLRSYRKVSTSAAAAILTHADYDRALMPAKSSFEQPPFELARWWSTGSPLVLRKQGDSGSLSGKPQDLQAEKQCSACKANLGVQA
jgi:hypothetical protein